MNQPFINELAIEINQYPRYVHNGDDLFTIKEIFWFNSLNKQYGHRDTVIPTSFIINKKELPQESVLTELINSKVPVIKRIIDSTTNQENWVFFPNELGETKK
jgi:hypothetical protein